MAQQITPPHDNSFVELLSKALLGIVQSIVQKLTEPIFLFVIAICVIALLAAAIGGESLFVELRIFLAFLAVVAIAAVIISQFLSRSAQVLKPPSGGAKVSQNSPKMDAREKRKDLLRQCLDRLNDTEFQELRILLLSPSERNRLIQPVTRMSFVGDLELWGGYPPYLDRLEDALRDREEWRKRFPDLLEQMSENRGDRKQYGHQGNT